VGDLEVREEPAVHEGGRAEAGAEGHHQLEARAGHDREALDIGVVRHAGGLADRGGERARQVEVVPGGDELGVDFGARSMLCVKFGRREDVALAEHAREAAATRSASGRAATNLVNVSTIFWGGMG